MIRIKMCMLENLAHYFQNQDCIKNIESKNNSYYPVYMGGHICTQIGDTTISYNLKNLDEAAYLAAAIMIPYNDMLENVKYYNNDNSMDEIDEINWFEELQKRYNLNNENGYLTVVRFRAVDKLNRNLISRLIMKKLYSNDNTKNNDKRLSKYL